MALSQRIRELVAHLSWNQEVVSLLELSLGRA